MLVILKIPVVYLCAVVWWAIKAEPRPLEGAGTVASLGPQGPSATGVRGAPESSVVARRRGVAAAPAGPGESPTPERG